MEITNTTKGEKMCNYLGETSGEGAAEKDSGEGDLGLIRHCRSKITS